MFMHVAASLLVVELAAGQAAPAEGQAPARSPRPIAAPPSPSPGQVSAGSAAVSAVPIQEYAVDIAEDWASQPAPRKKIVERAIRETLKEDREVAAAKAEADSKAAAIPRPYRASSHPNTDAQERFEALFADAKVPGCLTPQGLKRQPTFIFAGLLALPFVAVAKIRGKCN